MGESTDLDKASFFLVKYSYLIHEEMHPIRTNFVTN